VVTLAELFVYPVKSCRGIAVRQAELGPRGLQYDREWMVVSAQRRFLTQREAPRLALVTTALQQDSLELSAPGLPAIGVPLRRESGGASVEVTVWRDHVLASDEGDAAASWFSGLLQRDVRLVRFDASRPRHTDPAWSQGLAGESAFSDGYPVLVLSRGSLDDLNARLPSALPLDRFRPNIVLHGCAPYAEDTIRELACDGVRLRRVKPCTRCIITTTDQATATPQGDEPLRTLRRYGWDAGLHGVTFGQNAIVLTGGLLATGCRLNSD
jgi:uncharacterized protein YcbX